jgi:hypothetical protein
MELDDLKEIYAKDVQRTVETVTKKVFFAKPYFVGQSLMIEKDWAKFQE